MSRPLAHAALAFLASACGAPPAAVVTKTVAPTTSTTTTTSTTVTSTNVVQTTRTSKATVASVETAIRTAFGPAGNKAVAVARCESRLIPTARNGVHAGLFQLSRHWHEGRARRLGFAWAQMYEAGPNIAVALDLYREAGWSPWTCRWAA